MPSLIPTIETARLLLRALEAADAPQVQRIFPQWNIVKYLNARVPWPYPADGAESFFREIALPAMQRSDAWFWTLRRKSTPEELIGVINLRISEEEHRGFWLDPLTHGKGYMTEACEPVTDYWFDVSQSPVLRVAKAFGKYRFATYFGATRHARNCFCRARLRLRPAARGNLGDYGGRMACKKPTQAPELSGL